MTRPRPAQRLRPLAALGCALAALQLAACAGVSPGTPLNGRTPGEARLHAYNKPYLVRGRRYTPVDAPGYDETGTASWYGYESGHATSDGERFTLGGLTAAHRTLPIPSLLEVTNLDTGAKVVLRLNDRGPFAPGRLLDVSHEAARRLGFLRQGTARVRVRYLGPAPSGPVQTFAQAPARSYASPVARIAAPPPAAIAPAPPPAGLEALQLVADLPSSPAPPPPTPAAADAAVQAGAFSEAWRAERAAQRLDAVGEARVLAPAEGSALYRVLVRGEAGEGARLRDRVAAMGFPDARLLSD